MDGWNDTAVPPKVAVNYYNQVVATVGARASRASMRFFMVPAMGHGPGTTGPLNLDFDALSLIEQWKERGQAPDTLTLALFRDGTNVGTRLVCQYPRVAFYTGTGRVEDASSFRCREK